MKNKVVITAFIGSRNLGDEAIFKSILSQIKVPKKDILALCVNEEKTKKQGVNTLYSNSIPNLIKGIKNADAVLMGGGGIIQDQSSLLNFLYYSLQLFIAKRYKTPVILNFVGVGPIRFSFSRWLMKKWSSAVHYAIVRDDKSREMLSEYISSDKILQANDPVLNFPVDKKKIKNTIYDKEPYVVVSLRRWFFANPFLPVFISRQLNRFKIFRKRYDRLIFDIAKAFDMYLSKNPKTKLVFVSLYDGEDDLVSEDVRKLMKHKDKTLVAEKNMDEHDFFSIINNSMYIVGMRLHSLILGANLHKPFVSIRYSTKVDEFTRQMGLIDKSVHVDNLDPSELVKAMESVESSRGAIEADIEKRLTTYRDNNTKAFAVLNKKISEIIK